MKTRIVALLTALMLLACATAMGEDYHVAVENEANFAALFTDLYEAYTNPDAGRAAFIDPDLEAIRGVNTTDYAIAQSIAAHWRRVYLDDAYALRVHRGEEKATALAQTALQDSPTHAFVVLGYELKDGEMTRELKGRCEAAAAAARAFPSAILVCSGGATGENNPHMHTEAGMMRDYLVKTCGIDAARIFIDEQAKTTVQNARNTFAILEQKGIETMTIVTSTYHQRWGQVIYNAVGTLYALQHGYSARIVENYCFDIEPAHSLYRDDAKIALRQLASILRMPRDEG